MTETRTMIAVELDAIEGNFGAEPPLMGAFAEHLEALQLGAGKILAYLKPYPLAVAHLSPSLDDGDIEYFKAKPGRSTRLRDAGAEEFVRSLSGTKVPHVISLQIEPGCRLLVSVNFGMPPNVSTASVLEGLGVAAIDDDLLTGLFELICRHPGKVIDIAALVDGAKALSKLRGLSARLQN